MSKNKLSELCKLFGYVLCFIIMLAAFVPNEVVGGYGVKFLFSHFANLLAMIGFYWVSYKIFQYGGTWR